MRLFWTFIWPWCWFGLLSDNEAVLDFYLTMRLFWTFIWQWGCFNWHHSHHYGGFFFPILSTLDTLNVLQYFFQMLIQFYDTQMILLSRRLIDWCLMPKQYFSNILVWLSSWCYSYYYYRNVFRALMLYWFFFKFCQSFSHRWILGTRNIFLACSSLPCKLNYRQIILQLRVS